MRSVCVHLWNASEGEVTAILDKLYVSDHGLQWLDEIGGDAHLFVRLYREGPAESEDWERRFSSQGEPPSVSVLADISGRHDGWEQAQAFVVHMLEHFRGVAEDDGGLRFWSKEEVQADQRVNGRRFGWWRE
jgi:hypothetical protein